MKAITSIIAYFAVNSTIPCKFLIHQQANSIDLPVANDMALNQLVKNIARVSWSKTLKAWHIADAYTHRVRCKLLSIDKNTNAITNNNKINTETRELLNQYTHWMEVKRYSKSTIESYTNALPVFFSDYHTKYAHKITNHEVMDVNMHYILKKKPSIPLDKLKLNE
ncbi:MAG: hypothetical protein ACK5UI_01920 [Bacteroidota bacterium]